MVDQDKQKRPVEASNTDRKPRPKRKSFARRQEDARKWLERLVPPEKITDERIRELAAYTDRYRPGSRYQKSPTPWSEIANSPPTWAEVREVMGWDRVQTREVLFRLQASNSIIFTEDAGSLTLCRS
ncbi:hypothetical protein [Paenarthrobacter sp. NCHU4564]|uniref:hypothetical protein n=1 Tax=Paenarthrobacter sp. NCHU4564 TaxID=3451353 RepID=UPI003F946B2E